MPRLTFSSLLQRPTIAQLRDDAQSLDEAVLLLKADRDENTCREPFTIEEGVAMAESIERIERPKTKARHADKSSKGGKKAGKGRPATDRDRKTFPTPDMSALWTADQERQDRRQEESGRTKAAAASVVGMSRPTYEKAKEVIQAAKAYGGDRAGGRQKRKATA